MTEPRKLFVGGLSWETTKEGLHVYFSQFGEVEDSVIMMDPVTKKPRGFGFVTFTEEQAVTKCLNSGPHILDTKTIDPKLATMKGGGGGEMPQSNSFGSGGSGPVKKIFVGGLSLDTSDEDVRQYFMSYGNVGDVDLKMDKTTGKMRGFGFVGFDSEEVVEKVVQIHFHQINGKTVEAKKAEPRNAVGGASQKRPVQPGYQSFGAYPMPGYPSPSSYQYQQTAQGQPTAQQQSFQGYYSSSDYAQQMQQYQAAVAAAQVGTQQVGAAQSQRGYGQSAAYNRSGYNTEAAYTNAAAGYGYDSSYGDGTQQPAMPTSYGRGQQQQQGGRSYGGYQ